MSHSLSKVWVHAIWRTKHNLPLIKPKVEEKIFPFIRKQFFEMESPIKAINGVENHLHILFQLSPKKSIAEVMKQAKGSSSHYINAIDIINAKFVWQTGYGAFSVSNSVKNKVENYIKKQKEHHKKQSFKEEYEDFLDYHGLNKNWE